VVARAELAEISERRATQAATAAHDGPTNTEAARLIARVLSNAARKLGISEFAGLDELCQLILARAHAGGLDPASYRIAWTLSRRSAPAA
jgi:hypothetical protein